MDISAEANRKGIRSLFEMVQRIQTIRERHAGIASPYLFHILYYGHHLIDLLDVQESRIFGVVVPDYKLQFESMTKELISAGVNGLVLGGACMGENEDILFRAIQVVREIAGNAMPILVQGVRSLKLVRY